MSELRYLLALDQGTTRSRAVVFNNLGHNVAVAQRLIKQHYPHPGWVEHDPNEIWQTQRDTMDAALKQAGVVAGDIAAIGVTHQRETLVVWERATGKAVAPDIVWQDRRTADDCAQWRREGHESRIA